jgi:hypothetical protein
MSNPDGQHFWYSEKYQEHRAVSLRRTLFTENGKTVAASPPRHLYAEINSNEVEYNIMTSTRDASAYKWDDMKYLGQGSYKRSGDYL